ncbi:MAG: ATP-dependent metallopeptidase FtsH/Yme1/Tma family protein, partial [Bacteriovoracia bacterium]
MEGLKMNQNAKYLILISLVVLTFWLSRRPVPSTEISYSEFRQQLTSGNVDEVKVNGSNISGKFKKAYKDKDVFESTILDQELAKEFDQYNVKYKQEETSPLLSSFATFFIPLLFFWVIWFVLMKNSFKKGGGSFMTVGKSKAKIYVETNTKVTFKDVAGADEALEELSEIIDFLKEDEKVKELGGKMPKGVLLVGPPGTGKTLIAKAMAGEAGVPFFSTNGAEFVEMFVGVGAARVRDLFEQAKKSAPCIIFIDELDALGKVRNLSPNSSDEKEQTLNQLLVDMDGFDTKSHIIILAATNRPEILDPALLRAGRFDRHVLIDRPDRKGRVDILAIHSKKAKISPECKLE